MSIFYKFGCEAGDASNVTCDGMDMSLSDLKLAVVDQRRMNNVTEFDLQVENGQTGKVYTIEEELIPRGTTVQIRRIPLPRGEKKTWRAELLRSEGKNSREGGEVSSLVVTSTSEEGRLDQVLGVSGAEYGKDNWERISRPRGPRPLAGEPQKTERRYAYGIPSNMLVPATEQSATAKVDRFGSLKLTLVERDGYSQEKVENHSWLEEKEGTVRAVADGEGKEEVVVPKDLQCPFCCELLEAAILLPCCTAAACDECARNSLIEQDHVCKQCGEENISPNDLIPNPLLRKKVAAFRGSQAGLQKSVQVRSLAPLPNAVVPAETMLRRQREQEEERRTEKQLQEALLAKLMASEAEPEPAADETSSTDRAISPEERPDKDTLKIGKESFEAPEVATTVLPSGSPVSDDGMPPSPHPPERCSSPNHNERCSSPPRTERCSSPNQVASSPPGEPDSSTMQAENTETIDSNDNLYGDIETSEGQRDNVAITEGGEVESSLMAESTLATESTLAAESTLGAESTMATESTLATESNLATESTLVGETPVTTEVSQRGSASHGTEATYSIQSMSAPVPGQTIQTTYNNSYNTFYPGMFDYSQPPPGYPVYPNGYPASYPQDRDSYAYGGRMEDDRWRGDRRRPRSRSRDRGNYSNWERVHGDLRDGRGVRDRRRRGRSRSRERRKSREREKRRSRSREGKGGNSLSERERATKSLSRDLEDKGRRSRSRHSEGRRLGGDSHGMDVSSPSHLDLREDNTGDRKEEARQKLKDLICKNKERTKEACKGKDVKEGRDKKGKDKKIKKDKTKEDKTKDDVEGKEDLRTKLKQKKERERERDRDREMKREIERERQERDKESDGDWHCGHENCRFVNFQKNARCLKCGRLPPTTPVFWDIPSSPRRNRSPEKRKRTPEPEKNIHTEPERMTEAEVDMDMEKAKEEEFESSAVDESVDTSQNDITPEAAEKTEEYEEEGARLEECLSRGSGSRPGSRGQVTSFLDDLGDSFESDTPAVAQDENIQLEAGVMDYDNFKKPLELDDIESRRDADEVFKRTRALSDDEPEKIKPIDDSYEDVSLTSMSDNSAIKCEDGTAQDDTFSHDNDTQSAHDDETSQLEDTQGGESVKKSKVIPDTDPKYMWKDRSRTSEEFELSLEINDSDFVDTVKQEYRSSSPSWANQKFRFPVKKDKGGLNEKSTESSAEEAEKDVFSNTVNVTPAEFDKDAERTISVRRRMQDEIKKEDAIKLEKVDLAKSKKIVTKRDSSDQESSTEMPVKIKGDSATRKDRQYRRGSQDELENEERRDRSASSETERRKEEKRFRDERQRERDRKDREKNNRMREEEEERKRRLKLEDLRLEDEKRMRKKREDDKERELIKERKKMEERKLADEESRRRKREEEDLLRRQDKLNEEKRKLDAEKKEIERKRAEDDRRTKEKFFADKEASKRSRSRSDVEGGPSKKKFTGGDLRSQLNKKKEKTIITKKKTKKKKKKESSSESSSDSSSSSSDSDDSDSDVNAKLILGNPKLLKRILEAVTKTSKKKKIKKKKKKVTKSPKGEKVVPEQRRVVMAKEGGAITMQLDNQSQAEDEEDDIDLHLAKYNKKAAKILQGKRQTRDSDEVMESDKKRPKVDEDKERIQINIRNSAAFKRMNSKKKKKQKKYESSDGGSDSDGDDDSNSDPDPEDLEEGELESD